MSCRLQSKNWLGTSYRVQAFKLPEAYLVYGVYQIERCPETLREHVQFFVQTKIRSRLSAIKRLFPGDHLEIARSPDDANKYCQKMETRISPPVRFGVYQILPQKRCMVELMREVSVSQAVQENPTLWRNVHAMQTLRHLVSTPRSTATKSHFLTGVTGKGKTKIVSLICEFLGSQLVFWQDGSNWWDGYDGQAVVVVDEYRGQFPVSFLLRLLDRTPFRVPIKGSYVNFNSVEVFFMSNLDLRSIYKDIDLHTFGAIKRRINELSVY